MNVRKSSAVRSSLDAAEADVDVTALWDDATGTAWTWAAAPAVTSHLVLRNDSDFPIQHKLNTGAWSGSLPSHGTEVVRMNAAADSLYLRKAQFPTTEDAARVHIFVHGIPDKLILGEAGGSVEGDRAWDMPPEGLLMSEADLRWEDLRFPAQAINPVGFTSAPTLETLETGFPGTLLFSGVQDDMVAGVLQMPHAWAVGTEIRPHIHWLKQTGSASVASWQLYTRKLGCPGSVAEAWSAANNGVLTSGNPAQSNEQLLTVFGAIDMAGQVESAMVAWRLYRRGTTDADNNGVTLLELDFHYQVTKQGTKTEFPSP